MATDGPDPEPCEDDIYRNGVHVMTIGDVSSNRMERWVKRLASESGQRVDWHYAAGYAIVKVIGDVAAVEATAAKMGAP